MGGGISRRTVVIAVLAVALLLVLVVATGNNYGPSSPPAQPTAPTSTGVISGLVASQVHHLSGRTWQFSYTIHDTGKTPIAGFQINGQRANLYDITSSPHWTVFGDGVCKGSTNGVLVYWSIGPGASVLIPPGGRGHFSFKVNTSGTTRLQNALSYSQLPPEFGTLVGPSPSSLPPSGKCL